MELMRYFELAHLMLKRMYGDEYKKLSMEEKMGAIVILLNDTGKDYPEIMQGMANAAYVDFTK